MDDMSPEDIRSNIDHPIIDPSGISLDRLAELDDSALIRSLNRFLGDIDNPQGVIFAGFNASI